MLILDTDMPVIRQCLCRVISSASDQAPSLEQPKHGVARASSSPSTMDVDQLDDTQLDEDGLLALTVGDALGLHMR